MFVFTNIFIVLILLVILVSVIISIFLNNNNNIETFNINNNIKKLNPDTYINTNNTNCCSKTTDTNLIPLAYNDFCNSLKDQSYKYEAPDEYNKYCSTDLLVISPTILPESRRAAITPAATTQAATTPAATTPAATIPAATTPAATTPAATTPAATTPAATKPAATTPAATTPAATIPETTISVTYPIIKPYGYGSIRGWYSSKKSSYLYDNPITMYYNQMNNNYVNINQQWKLLHIPTAAELPNYGDWWDWTIELQNINRVIDYLGDTLGKFETHIISMAGSSSSPGTQRVNNEALAIIARDWKLGFNDPPTTPRSDIRVENCGGVCLVYLAKNNKLRLYMAVDLGLGHTNELSSPGFINMPSDYKTKWLRDEIYSSISHEYTHVFQNQKIRPKFDFVTPFWYAEESSLGERSPSAISRWWLESFATILPSFMGFDRSSFNLLSKVTEAINIIKNTPTLTVQEFSDRLMYVQPYGYLPATPFHVFSFLTAAYMAKLTSWKNVLIDWYYDFQRVPANTSVSLPNNNGTIFVPNLDNMFLHHFNKTEENFLKDVYTKVKSNVITVNYLSNVLPNGSDYNIPNLIKYTSIN